MISLLLDVEKLFQRLNTATLKSWNYCTLDASEQRDKKVIELKEITFLGHKLQITSESIKADDTKTKAIIDMPSPANISGVKRFCVVVQFRTKFLPSLQLSNNSGLLHNKTHHGPD